MKIIFLFFLSLWLGCTRKYADYDVIHKLQFRENPQQRPNAFPNGFFFRTLKNKKIATFPCLSRSSAQDRSGYLTLVLPRIGGQRFFIPKLVLRSGRIVHCVRESSSYLPAINS
jgi:hypothetical protein